MTMLKLTFFMILLAGSAAAQVSSTTSGAPDVEVINISWRRVESNPRLIETQSGGSPDYAQRMAVNTARINEANSARAVGGNPPPPKLLSLPSIPDSPPPIMRPWVGFIYKFTVRNTGVKTIRQVFFEHSFIDPGTQRKVGRRQYQSKVKILPGMTARIVVRSSSPPIGSINATQAGQNSSDQSSQQMLIQRIKYADGSVWRRSSK